MYDLILYSKIIAKLIVLGHKYFVYIFFKSVL